MSKQKSSLTPVVVVLTLVALFMCIGVCALSSEPRKKQSAPVNIQERTTYQMPVPTAPEPEPNWFTEVDRDPMNDKTVTYRTTVSENMVELGFPYQGLQPLALVVREKTGQRPEIIIKVDRGQFGCGIRGCTVAVRFDDGEAFQVSGTEPASHDTTILFLGSTDKLLSGLRKAKMMRIQVGFYKYGDAVFEFDVTGFEG